MWIRIYYLDLYFSGVLFKISSVSSTLITAITPETILPVLVKLGKKVLANTIIKEYITIKINSLISIYFNLSISFLSTLVIKSLLENYLNRLHSITIHLL